MANDSRSFDERPARDITATCTLSASRTRDTSNDKVKTSEIERLKKTCHIATRTPDELVMS